MVSDLVVAVGRLFERLADGGKSQKLWNCLQ
jgi:hypothetical protein